MTFAEVLDHPHDGRVLGEQHGQGGIRKIIHIDADAFYASVEQRDNPELRGKPVAVGGSRARGVVAAASYEARRFGVHSAMPSVTAQRKCPDLIFVKPRFVVYREVSLQMREIFSEYTDLIEAGTAYRGLRRVRGRGQSALDLRPCRPRLRGSRLHLRRR